MDREKELWKAAGKRLAVARTRAGFSSQKAFAAAVGLAEPTVAKYEQGAREIPISLLFWLSDRYQMNADWIISGQGELRSDDPVKAMLDAGAAKDALAEKRWTGPDMDLVLNEAASRVTAPALKVDQQIFTELKRAVRRINADAGIKLPEDALDIDVVRWYNELLAMARGNLDEGKLRSLLPALEYEIAQAVKAAVAEPGTGKASA